MIEEQVLEKETLSSEEKAFIGGLGEEFEPSVGVEETYTPEPDSTAVAQQTAAFGLDMIESILKQHGHKDFSFDPDQKENTAAAIAPAIVKHNGELPPWLEPYKEEVFALLAVGVLGYTSYAQIKALKELDKPPAQNGEADHAANQSE